MKRNHFTAGLIFGFLFWSYSTGMGGEAGTRLDTFRFYRPVLSEEAGAGAEFAAVGTNGFDARLPGGGADYIAIAAADISFSGSAKYVLAFRFRGAAPGARLRVAIDAAGAGAKRRVYSPDIPLDAADYKDLELKLNGDFGLGDAAYVFTRIEFAVRPGAEAATASAGATFQLRDLRLASVDSLRLDPNAPSLVVVPYPRRATASAAVTTQKEGPPPAPPAPVKVYFEFDNDDLNFAVKRFTSGSFPCEDTPRPDAGFRNLLLENVEDLFVPVASPGEAEVMVYSRAAPGGKVEDIRRAVAAGKRLLIFGAIPEGDRLDDLSPLRLEPVEYPGFPPRRSVRFSPGSALFSDPALHNADYGAFFKTTLADPASANTSVASKEVHAFFEDNSPCVAERGGVMHFATGPGVEFVKSPVYYSKTFLRAAALRRPEILDRIDAREARIASDAARRERELVSEVAAAAGVDPQGYRVGEVSDGFGRFGWYLDATAMGGVVNRDLSVSIGNKQGYAVQFGGARVLPLADWTRRVVEGEARFSGDSDSPILESWSGVGVVEYSAEVLVPADWKDSEIRFEVGFIDDLDQLFVNGVKVGETGEDRPNYWQSPRRYRIAPDVLRFGQKNALRLRVVNLRGGAAVGGVPALHAGGGRGPLRVGVSSIDRAGKEYRIAANGFDGDHAKDNSKDKGENFGVGAECAMRLSMLTPFIRYTLPAESASIRFDRTLGFAALPDTDGAPRVVRLDPATPIPINPKSEGAAAVDRPWMLLFRQGPCQPLLLVFEYPPDAVRLEALSEDGSGVLRLERAGGVGTLSVGGPFDRYDTPDCSGWDRRIPPAAAERVELYLNLAANYPVGCEDIFRVDREAEKIDVVLRFRHQPFGGGWTGRVRDFVLLPPQVSFMAGEKRLAGFVETTQDFGYRTGLGPLRGKLGVSTIRYTLDSPPRANVVPVGIADPWNGFQNERFAKGVVQNCHWSAFGQWTAARPNGGANDLANIDLHAWNYGLTSAMQGVFFLTPENRDKLEFRAAKRVIEPLERYAHKAAVRHRREPFSGLLYPVLFNSSYPNPTPYAPGFGSKVNYGDANETVSVLMWNAQFAADLLGQSGMAAPNWNFLRYAMRYQLYGNDLWVHAGQHRENGTGAYLDMLNGEYSGAALYARLAELAGDDGAAEFGWYLAAKKALPTVSRFYFRDYFGSINPTMRGADNYQICGYSLSWPMHMAYPNSNHNFLNADDVFDCSQGMHGSLIALYRRYALPKIHEHFRLRAIPSLVGGEKKKYSYAYLAPLGFFGEDNGDNGVGGDHSENRGKSDGRGFELSAYAAEVMERASGLHAADAERGCWSWLRNPFELGAALWRRHGKIAIEESRRLDISSALHDPAKGRLSIILVAGDDALLIMSSAAPPREIRINGRLVVAAVARNLSGEWSPPLVQGRNEIEARW